MIRENLFHTNAVCSLLHLKNEAEEQILLLWIEFLSKKRVSAQIPIQQYSLVIATWKQFLA